MGMDTPKSPAKSAAARVAGARADLQAVCRESDDERQKFSAGLGRLLSDAANLWPITRSRRANSSYADRVHEKGFEARPFRRSHYIWLGAPQTGQKRPARHGEPCHCCQADGASGDVQCGMRFSPRFC